MAIPEEKFDEGIIDVIENGQSMMVDGIQNTAANLKNLIDAKNQQNTTAGRVAGSRPLMRRCNLSGLDTNGTI